MSATSTNRPVSVLYFAWLRERVGSGEESLELPPEVTDIGGLIAHLRLRHPTAFDGAGTVRCAVNQEFGDANTPVRPGDEVAFFPPVTGG